MTVRPDRRAFTARPADVERWIKAPDARSARDFTARLTIDVTPALRGRIKVAAFQRGQTMADMLRDLLTRAFPDSAGGTS